MSVNVMCYMIVRIHTQDIINTYFFGRHFGVFLYPLISGGVLGKMRALRDDSRFLGKESTVPVRLVYRTDNGQTAHDVLSTRARASPGTDQVSFHHYPSFSNVVYVCVQSESISRLPVDMNYISGY